VVTRAGAGIEVGDRARIGSVSNSQRRWQRRCQEADNVSCQSAFFIEQSVFSRRPSAPIARCLSGWVNNNFFGVLKL
jgi:hypothetical protein